MYILEVNGNDTSPYSYSVLPDVHVGARLL